MTVCFFGLYKRDYSRNHIFLKGLKENKIKVIECGDRGHFIYGSRYIKLLIKFFRLKAWQADVLFVGFPGQTDVPLAWVLGKLFNKKIIFDAFYSLYVSHVFDRKRIKEKSLRAKGYWFVDYLSCILADRVVLDTNAHIGYFVKEFKFNSEKFHRIFVGTDPDLIRPVKVPKHSGFVAGFHGSFLPLQGVPVILDAAKILEKTGVDFYLLGNGVEFVKCKRIVEEKKITNVKFFKEVRYEELSSFISRCDIYLSGPFGDSLKSSMVIPNKVYEALAVQKPVIVGDSPATKELLTNEENCLIVNQGNPEALAKSIIRLKKDKQLREKIARNGYNLIITKLTPKELGKELMHVIQ